MNRYSSDKDLNKFANEQSQKGWTIQQNGKNHLTWTHPSGAKFFSSQTPSCPYAIKKIKNDLRKALLSKGIDIRARSREEQIQHRQKIERREERMQEPLKHNIPLPKPKDLIYIQTARKMLHDMVRGGKTPDDAVTVLMAAFNVRTPVNQAFVQREKLFKIASNLDWGKWGKIARAGTSPTTAVVNDPIVAKPTKTIAEAMSPSKHLSSAEIDDKVRHIRAVIDMPLGKQKRMDIIIDLLDTIL